MFDNIKNSQFVPFVLPKMLLFLKRYSITHLIDVNYAKCFKMAVPLVNEYLTFHKIYLMYLCAFAGLYIYDLNTSRFRIETKWVFQSKFRAE